MLRCLLSLPLVEPGIRTSYLDMPLYFAPVVGSPNRTNLGTGKPSFILLPGLSGFGQAVCNSDLPFTTHTYLAGMLIACPYRLKIDASLNTVDDFLSWCYSAIIILTTDTHYLNTHYTLHTTHYTLHTTHYTHTYTYIAIQPMAKCGNACSTPGDNLNEYN